MSRAVYSSSSTVHFPFRKIPEPLLVLLSHALRLLPLPLICVVPLPHSIDLVIASTPVDGSSTNKGQDCLAFPFLAGVSMSRETLATEGNASAAISFACGHWICCCGSCSCGDLCSGCCPSK